MENSMALGTRKRAYFIANNLCIILLLQKLGFDSETVEIVSLPSAFTKCNFAISEYQSTTTVVIFHGLHHLVVEFLNYAYYLLLV